MVYYSRNITQGVNDTETVSGLSNWRLIVRREADHVIILRGTTCDVRAALPDTLFGLPVTALERHALSPEQRETGGEEILITCGGVPAQAEWNTRLVQDLTFPSGLTRVGDYALLNCVGLKTIRLHDSVTHWGGGALMNCRQLDTFFLTRTGAEQGESLAFFAGELPRELDVTVNYPDGTVARLLFPEYQEIYEENCPAHHFDYVISGAGYPYHHCFRQKQLRLKEYDALWPAYLGMEHEPEAAVRLAWQRLRWPAELTDKAASRYRAYLQAHVPEAMDWLLKTGDAEGLQFLLSFTEPDHETLAAASAQAREGQNTAAVAILIEEQHRRFPAGALKSFDL